MLKHFYGDVQRNSRYSLKTPVPAALRTYSKRPKWFWGLNHGLPFLKLHQGRHWAETPLSSAAEMAVLVSGMSIECADTIEEKLD